MMEQTEVLHLNRKAGETKLRSHHLQADSGYLQKRHTWVLLRRVSF